MPAITFDRVCKKFGEATVIDSFSVVVPDKEFLVLVGPSGCGKSTILRMIAGLTELTSGSIQFDGKSIEATEARSRDIAFVFQSYALYPHLTVRGNIAFPLVMRVFRWWYHIPLIAAVMRRALMNEAGIRAKVAAVAERLHLTPLLERRPSHLSGGQRQRVAVARALVREPSVYLLDEPLSNLDAALRTQMRAEIMALYRSVEKNFIYVTHDQVEAMTMGTRIIVLDKGVVQQYATPAQIYERPANIFVARFIGVPQINLMPVREVTRGSLILSNGAQLPVSAKQAEKITGLRDTVLGLRPEMIEVLPWADETSSDGLTGRVLTVEYLGAENIVTFVLGSDRESEDAIVIDDDATLRAKTNDFGLRPGERCRVRFNLDKASYFDRTTGLRVDLEAASSEGASGDTNSHAAVTEIL